MTKTAYNKLIGKDLSISSQIRNEARVSVLPVLFNKLLKVSSYSNKTRTRDKWSTNRRNYSYLQTEVQSIRNPGADEMSCG